MKTIIHILALAFFVGCASHQKAQLPAQIKEAQQRYAKVSSSMSRDDVHRILGAPQQMSAGVERWQVQEGNYVAALSITFSPTGKIASIDDPGLFVAGQ
jgi:hypothetical protein